MLAPAGLLLAVIGSLALIARELRKAPEGYEDEHGFHIVRKGAVGWGVPESMAMNLRGLRSSRRRPMRNALAH